jgi:hypothetical protein
MAEDVIPRIRTPLASGIDVPEPTIVIPHSHGPVLDPLGPPAQLEAVSPHRVAAFFALELPQAIAIISSELALARTRARNALRAGEASVRNLYQPSPVTRDVDPQSRHDSARNQNCTAVCFQHAYRGRPGWARYALHA